MKDPKFARFYLLPKIHKRLYNVPDRLVVISNSGWLLNWKYFTISGPSFKTTSSSGKFYLKETNEFLKKLRSLPKLPDGIILCTMDVVGLYPIILHDEGLSAVRKRFESRKEKYVSTDTIIDLAEVVLKKKKQHIYIYT